MIDVSVITPADINVLFDIIEYETRQIYLLAGGTDLVVRAKDGLIRNAVFVNIQNLDELKGIELEESYFKIGALCTHTEIIENPLVNEYARVLALAASEVGSPQIRNLGTIGGNVGNASPAGDTIPALYALDAEVVIKSADDEYTVKIYDFFEGPGKTVLKRGEIIKEFRIPLKYKGYQSFFKKLGQRKALAISKINIAVNLKMNEDVIEDIKIAYGAVAPTVIRALKTEEYLLYKTLDERAISEAEKIAAEEVAPIDDLRSTSWYRREMAGVLLRKVLREV